MVNGVKVETPTVTYAQLAMNVWMQVHLYNLQIVQQVPTLHKEQGYALTAQ